MKILQYFSINISEKVHHNFQKNLFNKILNDEKKIFFPGQIFELIRWLTLYGSDKVNDGETFNDSNVRTDFFKALLYSAEFWDKNTNEFLHELPKEILITNELRLNSLRTCRLNNFGTDNNGPGLKPDFALERGYYFFTTLINKISFNLQYKDFEKTFSDATNLSLFEYQEAIALLGYMQFKITHPESILSQKNASIFDINSFLSKVPEYQKKFQPKLETYLNLESQTTEELKENSEDIYNFILSLREKPIFRTIDGRFCILAPVFFIERATVGPLFIVSKNDKKTAANVFSNFGKIFEEYIREIFERMIPRSNILYSPYISDNVEIDTVLNYTEHIIISETKATWINDKPLYKSSEEYLNELNLKYCSEKDKGIYQLARKVKEFIDGVWGNEFSNNKIIFPVLIIHNRFDNSPIHSNFFNVKFTSKLKELLNLPDEIDCMQVNSYTIKPLIVITVDDLEAIESIVTTNHQDNKSFINFIVEYDNFSNDRNTSFHNFIALNDLAAENNFLSERVKERIKYFKDSINRD